VGILSENLRIRFAVRYRVKRCVRHKDVERSRPSGLFRDGESAADWDTLWLWELNLPVGYPFDTG